MRILLLVIMSFSVVAQIPKEKKGWFRISEQFITSDKYLEASLSKSVVPIRTNSYYTTTLSFAYGFTGHIIGLATIPFLQHVVVNNQQYNQSGKIIKGGSKTGIGDSDIGIQYVFFPNKRFQVAPFLILGLPLGSTGNPVEVANLQTGDGEFNQLLGLQLQYSISNSFYVTGNGGFNNRTKNYSNDIHYGMEIGYMVPKTVVKLFYNGIESLFNTDGVVSLNGMYSNQLEIKSIGIDCAYYFYKNIGLTIGTNFVFDGRNTLYAPTYSLGIQLKK